MIEAIEEYVQSRTELDVHQRTTLRSLLHRWMRLAEPGNWAWQALENMCGFHGDYSPADHGMNWGDNN